MQAYLPPQQFLNECFVYDPETGVLRWRERPDHHFAAPRHAVAFNHQNAGKQTGAPNEDGYLRTEVRYAGRRIRARTHRIIFKMVTGTEPENIDHRDLNRSNNRWRNLRPATVLQNSLNRAGVAGRSLPKGVYLDRGRIRAAVSFNRRAYKLGTFPTVEAAQAAYAAAASRLHGEFFCAGQPSASSVPG